MMFNLKGFILIECIIILIVLGMISIGGNKILNYLKYSQFRVFQESISSNIHLARHYAMSKKEKHLFKLIKEQFI